MLCTHDLIYTLITLYNLSSNSFCTQNMYRVYVHIHVHNYQIQNTKMYLRQFTASTVQDITIITLWMKAIYYRYLEPALAPFYPTTKLCYLHVMDGHIIIQKNIQYFTSPRQCCVKNAKAGNSMLGIYLHDITSFVLYSMYSAQQVCRFKIKYSTLLQM